MTLAKGTGDQGTDESEPVGPEMVSVTIDGHDMSVPAGTLVIRAAELMGVQIPRFCDHPLLEPVGACRQCLVDVEGGRKPVASCTTPVAEGMVVHTQLTSPAAEKAQRGVMELLLINHPLDCPVCDKGGECPLQNQAMSTGRPESRFDGVKRTFPKPIPLSTEILLDRERCVLCARCTRFSKQVAGDPFVDLLERGAQQQVGIFGGGDEDNAEGEPLDSYFSGNTVQICPVGALTSTTYRFRARPFDLVSSPSACEHCASGCSMRTDHRRGKVLRRLAGDDPEVNEEWNCDKGRFAFTYARERDRIDTPLIRGQSGQLEPASWSEALALAGRGLASASSVGVLVGGRCTWEDAYGYSKFARMVLGTNNIDFRARASSREEEQFLASRVAGRRGAVTYRDLVSAPVVLCVGFEPEEESPIVFLRLRNAVRSGSLAVHTIAPFLSAGAEKLSATLIQTVPGDEAAVLDQLRGSELLRTPGAVILTGERLAAIPGALSAAARLADDTGALLGWIPRRAGERGALEAGALPTLLPGGRRVDDADARRDVARVWGVDALPARPGRDTESMLAAARNWELPALLVGGVEPDDLPDPDGVTAALKTAGLVVSLELRRSAVTEHADVVFPIAPVVEKEGTFLSWEGRVRAFDAALDTAAMSDLRVLSALADAMGTPLGVRDAAGARGELRRLGADVDEAQEITGSPAPARTRTADLGAGQAIVASWRMLLDEGRGQDGEPHLAGTARTPVARISASRAAELGVIDGQPVTVSTDRGAITLPAAITDLPDAVVWLPLNSPGSNVYRQLSVGIGAVVTVTAGTGVDSSVDADESGEVQ
ncbi:MAG: NADH-quinone oxidoreductase subunit G [Rhodococcus sp.]|nr:NADH-quinone oxidoreductase subunit G [Rhodococcus sp. (in: high G+C Gram-positive bacteria)]